jgi:hypothetical protein
MMATRAYCARLILAYLRRSHADRVTSSELGKVLNLGSNAVADAFVHSPDLIPVIVKEGRSPGRYGAATVYRVVRDAL